MKSIYLLILRLDADLADFAIGRLGCYCFTAGYYLYVGSAFGSGGITARLAHHQHRPKPLAATHIDYLREHTACSRCGVSPRPHGSNAAGRTRWR
ncbi:MAG: DUF123 domain-containing protein [Kouleothrix sp.]